MENFTDFLSTFNKVWIWSDTHFGHVNIIKYCNRPFKDIDDMDQTLERNWHNTVGPDDLLINCGDFTFKDTTKANALIDRCPGTSLLIIGNHDYKKRNVLRPLTFDFISESETFEFEGHEFILSHVPRLIRTLGTAFNIHGHIHDKFYEDNGKISKYHSCVSVEHTNYKPVLLTDVCTSLLI